MRQNAGFRDVLQKEGDRMQMDELGDYIRIESRHLCIRGHKYNL